MFRKALAKAKANYGVSENAVMTDELRTRSQRIHKLSKLCARRRVGASAQQRLAAIIRERERSSLSNN